jgi:hypothetical protein
MKKKMVVLAVVTVAVGAFAFTRSKNSLPSDFRDAVGENSSGEGSDAFNTGLPAIEEADSGVPVPKAEMVNSLPQDQGSRYAILHPVEDTSVTVDNSTELMWITNPAEAGIGGKYVWTAAKAACEKSAYAGYGDWRLPEKTELAGILVSERSNPAANAKYFLNSHGHYWTATADEAQPNDSAWHVNSANAQEGKAAKEENGSIRCVRAAPSAKTNTYKPTAKSGKQEPETKDLDEGKAVGESGGALNQPGGEGGQGYANIKAAEHIGTPPGKAHMPSLAQSGLAAGLAGNVPMAAIEKSVSAETASENSGALFNDKPSAVAGAGVVGLNIFAGTHFLSALALKAQALSMAGTATGLAGQAGAAAAAGNMAQAQQLGMQAKTLGATAKATGAKAMGTAHSAVVLTAISGGIMVADGLWNIHTGVAEGQRFKDELQYTNDYLENAPGPYSQTAAQEIKDNLQLKIDKAKELVAVGGVKTGAGALQLGSLLVAPAVAPVLLAAGSVVYLGAVIYQHREAIKDFFRRLLRLDGSFEMASQESLGEGSPDRTQSTEAQSPDAPTSGEEGVSPDKIQAGKQEYSSKP